MSRPRQKVPCQCGCGQLGWPNQMVEVKADRATDKTLRETVAVNRFRVLRACEEGFTEELALMYGLKVLLDYYVSKPWWRRLSGARKILRLQHSIYERTKGFKWAHDHAVRSAALFACPKFMQGFMARRFLARAQRRKAKEDAIIALDQRATEAQAT